jgi:KaiC/GvpD/RAD55 family RecA-like ATPase
LNVVRSASGAAVRRVRENGREKSLTGCHAYVRSEAPLLGRTRIKTYIRGFDDAIGGGIPQGYVVLLSGAPGTMKSSFAYSVLYQNAKAEGRKGAYFTLEQSKDILLEHMGSLGMAEPAVTEKLTLLDMGNIRKNLSYLQGRGTWLELFKMYISNVMKTEPLSILVVDSLDVLETMSKFQDRRSDLYFLFEWLRDLGPLIFLIAEKPLDLGPTSLPPDEAYLSDGIIHLGMHPTTDLYVQRRLRVVKMRTTKHDPGYYALSFEDGGFEVARAVSGSS